MRTLMLLVVLAIAAPVPAATLYGWRTDGGTLEFTDDPARIPERYRDQAEELNLDLRDYRKLTVPEPARPGTRLEELRRLNGFYPPCCARRWRWCR